MTKADRWPWLKSRQTSVRRPRRRRRSYNSIDVRLVFDAAAAIVLALDGVTFDVPAGQITTVVGPSGCGKTTLLRLAAGLTKPSSGQVLYKGKAVAGAQYRSRLHHAGQQPVPVADRAARTWSFR